MNSLDKAGNITLRAE